MKRLWLYLLLSALAMLSLLPFFWLICAPFKSQDDFWTYTFLPSPSRWTLANFGLLFRNYPFVAWITNSLFVSCANTASVVTLSSLGGFALAKYEFRGKRLVMVMMAVTMLVPGQVILPSLKLQMDFLGWTDSYAAILVPGMLSVFGIVLFKQAMGNVPDELLHAGRVDGCSELRLWWEVALPIVRPMIGAFTLLTFMGSWNNFLWPQIILQSQEKYTLPIGLANMMGLPAYLVPYGALMAGTLISVLPVAILFFILQRDFISGLTSGAVKG